MSDANTFIAHTQNKQGVRQDLDDHLKTVAGQAAYFGKAFDAANLAYCVGLAHDLGKYSDTFQRYLCDAEAQHSAHKCDHKGAGAVYLESAKLGPLAFLVQGHHGGVQSRKKLNEWLRERRQDPAVQEAIVRGEAHIPELQSLAAPDLPLFIQDGLSKKDLSPIEFFLRMLFSTLVDADFLDTERHFHSVRSHQRALVWDVSRLAERFQAEHTRQFQHVPPTRVNTRRATAYIKSV
jgi:CRISPR-associated endonuclease/helicase Cas3